MFKYRFGERGSTTVFVTMILIPTIFLSGLLIDIARIKLYSNQALMTADSYGEAILAEYDNVLKELYGLFSVTQNEEGKKAIETLQEYMKTSFDPTVNSPQFQHLKGTILNKEKSFDGYFIPYKNADILLEWQAASDEANLKNMDVLSTQIGDFMRYRIAQSFMNNSGDSDDATETGSVLDILDEVSHVASDTQLLAKKSELDQQVGKVLELEKKYYYQLDKMNSYYEKYLKGINQNYQKVKREIDGLVDDDRFKTYIKEAKKYAENKDLESCEVDVFEEGEFFDEEFDEIIKSYQDFFTMSGSNEYPVTFSNYDREADNLSRIAEEYRREAGKIKGLLDGVYSLLDEDGDISEDLKKSVRTDLDTNYSNITNTHASDTYINLSNDFVAKKVVNSQLRQEATDISYGLDDEKSFYLRYYYQIQDQYNSNKEKYDNRKSDVKVSKFDNIYHSSEFISTYSNLKKTYGENSGESGGEKPKEQEKAESLTEETEGKLEEDEPTTARDIPAGVEIGREGKASILKFDEIIKSASGLLDNNYKNVGTEMLLKAYTVSYDFGMFSDRITEKKGDEEQQKSFTGYPLCEDINYLYGAELEYLFGGYKSSKENLNETRNQILLFRFAVNLASTFTVKEVNEAIMSVTKACALAAPAGPLVAILAAAAIRIGVATVETYADWTELIEGESVVVFKKDLKELTCYEKVVEILPELTKGGTDSNVETKRKSFRLNYEQYLTVLLLIFTSRESVIERTGDLICLNVNNVEQGSDFKTLSFKMEDAITAVNASCGIHLQYGVMPDGFAKQSTDSETYQSIKEFEKNYYKYSIIRGY